MDLDTFLTTLYVLIDDWYKGEMQEVVGKRRGPKPQMSDSEVLTVAVAGQWRVGVPWRSERGVVRYMQKHGRQWFPTMLQRSAFNERVRKLWRLLVILQQHVAQWLQSADDLYEVVDTVPLPACSLSQIQNRDGHWLFWSSKGHGGTRGGWYWGEQMLVSVLPQGAITGWLVGSAHSDDRWLLQALISQRCGQFVLAGPAPRQPSRPSIPPEHVGPLLACGHRLHTDYFLGDQGFNGWRWHDFWADRYPVRILSAPPTHAERPWSQAARRWLNSRRQIVETVFAVLTQVFDLQRLRAHSRWGQYTRISLATSAFNLGIFLNRRLGRPDLAHETLIC
jgi:hypothetical protein